MIIICFSYYPIQSGMEVTKRFMKIPRLPDYIRGKGNYVYSTTDAGFKNISILEVDDSKVKEAFELHGGPEHRFQSPKNVMILRGCKSS